jgi:hypothetical protein
MKAKKQGHGGYVQPIKGHVEIRGTRKPYLEIWIQLTPQDCKKLVSQIGKLERNSKTA